MRSTFVFGLSAGMLIVIFLGGTASAGLASGASVDEPSPQAGSAWARVYGDSVEVRGEDGAIDYGRFVWAPMDAVAAEALRDGGVEVTLRERPFELDLGGRRFDPVVDGAPRSALTDNWRAAEGPDWRLVQFKGPVRQRWLDELRAGGVEPVQYIHPHTYVVWSDAAAMSRGAAMESVRWHGEFLPEYRLAPIFRREGSARIDVHLMVRGGSATVRSQLGEVGAEIQSHGRVDRHFDAVDVLIGEDRLVELAQIPGVYVVQPVATDGGTRSEMSVQINSDNVDGTGSAFPGYLDYLDSLGLDGSGVIMACVDNGTQVNHPDLAGRMLPCTGPSCGNGTQTDGHGTHVAGIMAADGASGTMNAGGFLRGLGMAPGARMVEQRNGSVGAPWLLNLMRDSVRNDATISNNSWGPAGSPVGYDGNTRQVDVGVRDADMDEDGDQPLNYILAIMNGGGGTSTQGSPDEAKNIFTIGSSWAQTNANTQDMRNNEISANSAHGPALDGRFIPHMIAASRFTDSPLGTSGYGMQGGTSQAAPHVAGAVALFTEYYRNQFEADPSPALVKAAFLAVARDLVGNNDANDSPVGPRPDSKQGWGRMQTEAVLAPTLPVIYVDQTHVFSDTGEVWLVEYEAADPNEPMKLMLTWTDAPGHGLGGTTPAWNNDLDLRVSAGGELYLGNVFDQGWSATGGSADDRNNTEGVFLESAQHQGSVAIEVLAADINSSALPGRGGDNSQDFALACYNCVPVGGEGTDLAISMTAVPDPVQAGQILTWVIQVANFGPLVSDTVGVSLELPAELTFAAYRTLSAGGGANWDCVAGGTTVNCQLSDALSAPGLAPPLEIDAEIPADMPNSVLESHATVEGELNDPVPGNNTATETTTVITNADQVFEDRFEAD